MKSAGSPKENPASEKFSATSDNMEVVFALLGGESAVESATQWGNFILQGCLHDCDCRKM